MPTQAWVSILKQVHEVPLWLDLWAGSGWYWAPYVVGCVLALLGPIRACAVARDTVMCDKPGPIAMGEWPNIFAGAFNGYRKFILAFSALGTAAVGVFLARYSTPVNLLTDMGASGSLWRLSPEGVDLLKASLWLVLVVMCCWAAISAFLSFLIAFNPFVHPVFWLTPTDRDVEFQPGEGEKMSWRKWQRRKFCHGRAYFSPDGKIGYSTQPRQGDWIRLDLSKKDPDTRSYFLFGKAEFDVNTAPFLPTGAHSRCAEKGTILIGTECVKYDFSPGD
jgi:hypothetical protein